MFGDAATLGALFLFATLWPTYLADAKLVTTLAGEQGPLAIIGGALGFGALLTLAGNSVWQFLFPYDPAGGIYAWFRADTRDPRATFSNFRGDLAPTLGDVYVNAEAVEKELHASWPLSRLGGRPRLIAPEYLFYGRAPESLRDWIQRRQRRFGDALNSAAAIVIGIGVSHALVPTWELGRLLAAAGLLALAVASLLFAASARRDAEAMQLLWHRMGHPTGQVAEPTVNEPSR